VIVAATSAWRLRGDRKSNAKVRRRAIFVRVFLAASMISSTSLIIQQRQAD
jgi:hypothetical protein